MHLNWCKRSNSLTQSHKDATLCTFDMIWNDVTKLPHNVDQF